MRKDLFIILGVLFLIGFVSGICEDGQLDINSASLNELDELSGIGPVKAQAIIDARPIKSINNLIDVHGIGPSTLEKIKQQDLACVVFEEKEEETTNGLEGIVNEITKPKVAILETQVITLNAIDGKDIKSEGDREIDKSKYAIYGFVGFCVLIIVLSIFRRKKLIQNEFR